MQVLGQKIKAANSNVITILQKRVDLINKLMDIAKEYGNHEKLVHISVSNNVRNMFSSTNDEMLSINAFSQQFPELKSDATDMNLMGGLPQVENQLQVKREEYNHYVETYNSKRITFPNVLFANMLGFKEVRYVDVDNTEDIKEFKTDDGEILKDIIKRGMQQMAQATAQATDMTKKGFKKAKESIDSYKMKNEESKNLAKNQEANKAPENVNVTEQVQETMSNRCPSCGFESENEAKFCMNCGSKMNND